MQFDRDNNPYAPPTNDAEAEREGDDMQLPASIGSRWLARFIDGMLAMVFVIPVFVYASTEKLLTARDFQNQLLLTGIFWGAAMPINIYQWIQISRTGQSLGKKWLGLKIIRVNGAKVTFLEGVVLREWLTTVVGLIPVVGSLINLVGFAMIFGAERRCLHDRFAGTKVVQVLKG